LLDYVLGESLNAIQAGADSYTVVYLTTPGRTAGPKASPVHAELKRSNGKRADEGRDTRSLFEKYQFFTDGKLHLFSDTAD
jgi:hypothetical protein